MKHYFIQNFKSGLAIFFAATIFVLITTSCCKDCNCEDNKKIDYTKFFIAHAGGAIDGIKYTNCLEALDLSYSKGCRLFELDLSLTTDGKIVAAHDPPGITEAEFMNRPILGKYTPLNMEAINGWFRAHSNAVLITDKLNDPKKIQKEFQFRNRVIMELFTWEAVDTAMQLKIKPMVSENLIFGTSKKAIEMGIKPQLRLRNSEIEQILLQKKIEFICMSRYYCIAGNEDFLRGLKEKGIKNYVFHLELPYPIPGQSAEKYIWDYEMNFCYGMYANDLDLLTTLLEK